VARLLDQYLATAGWDVSTRVSNLGYIRRTIKPALGSAQVRKVRHMFIALAEAGLVPIRHGRTTTITGEPEGDTRASGRQRRQLTRLQYSHDCKLSGCKPHVCKPMAKSTIRGIHSILSGAFEAAERWEWVDRNPADSARPPTVTQKKRPATPPADVVNVIDQARAAGQHDIALYVWLVAITGVRRGELRAVQIADIDLSNAFNYVVKAGQKLRKDTKTHQERYIAIDPVTCALIRETLDETTTALAAVGLTLAPAAFLFSNDPAHSRPWNPDWVTHRVCDLAKAAGVDLDIKESGTTPPASSLPRASTSATPPPDSGIPAGALPR